jgi:hypothetical protein
LTIVSAHCRGRSDLARNESDGLPIIRPWNPAGQEFEGLPARLPSGAIVKIRVLAPRGFNFYGREFEEGECFYSTYSVMRTIQHCYEGEEGEKREVGESINARGQLPARLEICRVDAITKKLNLFVFG